VLYLKLFLNYVFVYLNILHIIESCHFFLSLSALNGITYKILVSLCRVVSILSIQQGSLDIFFLLQKSVSTRIAKLNKKIFVFWWRSNKSGNHSIPLLLLTTKVFSWMRFSLGGRRSLKLDETGFSVSVISIVDCFVCSFQLLSVRVYVCTFVRLFVCSFQLLIVSAVFWEKSSQGISSCQEREMERAGWGISILPRRKKDRSGFWG
jgi:hypothetical protein